MVFEDIPQCSDDAHFQVSLTGTRIFIWHFIKISVTEGGRTLKYSYRKCQPRDLSTLSREETTTDRVLENAELLYIYHQKMLIA